MLTELFIGDLPDQYTTEIRPNPLRGVWIAAASISAVAGVILLAVGMRDPGLDCVGSILDDTFRCYEAERSSEALYAAAGCGFWLLVAIAGIISTARYRVTIVAKPADSTAG